MYMMKNCSYEDQYYRQKGKFICLKRMVNLTNDFVTEKFMSPNYFYYIS